jgi:hypothetical protein
MELLALLLVHSLCLSSPSHQSTQISEYSLNAQSLTRILLKLCN